MTQDAAVNATHEAQEADDTALRLALAAPIAAPGPVATPEAEAPAPEPRRSLLRFWFGLRAAG